jgi:hypothetical protein
MFVDYRSFTLLVAPFFAAFFGEETDDMFVDLVPSLCSPTKHRACFRDSMLLNTHSFLCPLQHHSLCFGRTAMLLISLLLYFNIILCVFLGRTNHVLRWSRSYRHVRCFYMTAMLLISFMHSQPPQHHFSVVFWETNVLLTLFCFAVTSSMGGTLMMMMMCNIVYFILCVCREQNMFESHSFSVLPFGMLLLCFF